MCVVTSTSQTAAVSTGVSSSGTSQASVVSASVGAGGVCWMRGSLDSWVTVLHVSWMFILIISAALFYLQLVEGSIVVNWASSGVVADSSSSVTYTSSGVTNTCGSTMSTMSGMSASGVGSVSC